MKRVLIPATAAALSVPLALPAVFHYETNPAFLLAPLVGWAVVASADVASALFVIAGLGGLMSIFVSSVLYPDGRLFSDVLSLILLMFTAGFFFLGRHLAGVRKISQWLAIFSAVFVIPVALRLIILGQTVRFQGSDDFTYYNAYFFGLPTFASFGLNGGVHLTVIQAAIFCGAIFGTEKGWLSVLSAVGLSCAAMLIVGSDSRSSVIALVLLVALALAYALSNRKLWRRSAIVAIAIIIGIPIGIGHSMTGNRVFDLLRGVDTIIETKFENTTKLAKQKDHRSPVNIQEPAPGEAKRLPRVKPTVKSGTRPTKKSPLDQLTSGRLGVIKLATKELVSSPIVGTGFSPFGRYEPVPEGMLLSSTSHIYYLTIFWKGGLIFGVPFMLFLAVAASRLWNNKPWRHSPESAMAMAAVLVIFGFVALTYDTPNVPAAGALAFLLLGALTGPKVINGSVPAPQ